MTTIAFNDFMKINLIVARIIEAEPVPNTNKLMKLLLDDGAGERTIVAGVAQSYAPDELKGKKIVIVANLEPATIRGVESNGMLLAADVSGDPVVLFAPDEVPPGTRVR